jgi:hypothetical protein
MDQSPLFNKGETKGGYGLLLSVLRGEILINSIQD